MVDSNSFFNTEKYFRMVKTIQYYYYSPQHVGTLIVTIRHLKYKLRNVGMITDNS